MAFSFSTEKVGFVVYPKNLRRQIRWKFTNGHIVFFDRGDVSFRATEIRFSVPSSWTWRSLKF
jgi:hypothetical protein